VTARIVSAREKRSRRRGLVVTEGHVVDRIAREKNPVRVLRKWRDETQMDLQSRGSKAKV